MPGAILPAAFAPRCAPRGQPRTGGKVTAPVGRQIVELCDNMPAVVAKIAEGVVQAKQTSGTRLVLSSPANVMYARGLVT